jgi:hypothetical protein
VCLGCDPFTTVLCEAFSLRTKFANKFASMFY